MKLSVLADVHVGSLLRAQLSEVLEPPDAVVSYAAAEGWADRQNGVLQQLAKAAGFTHLLTYDKNMADKHEPHIPVLVIDNPSHGEEGRVPGDMSKREIERMTLAAAAAVGDRLNRDPPTRDGYYGIAIPGYRPRIQLQRIIDGKHKQHPNYDANRERWIREQRARSKSPTAKRLGR